MNSKNNKKGKRKQKNNNNTAVSSANPGMRKGGLSPIWSAINIPQLQKVHLRYTTRQVLNVVLGVSPVYILSMNSLYDPDITSVGAQCEYYDFWTQLYSYYRVYDCKLTVTFSNQASKPFVCVVVPIPGTSFSATTMDETMMLPCNSKVVVGALGSGDCVKTITRRGDIPQTMSRISTNAPIGVMLQTKTATGGTPTYPVSYALSCNTADGTTLDHSVAITVQLEYWADMLMPASRYAS